MLRREITPQIRHGELRCSEFKENYFTFFLVNITDTVWAWFLNPVYIQGFIRLKFGSEVWTVSFQQCLDRSGSSQIVARIFLLGQFLDNITQPHSKQLATQGKSPYFRGKSSWRSVLKWRQSLSLLCGGHLPFGQQQGNQDRSTNGRSLENG